jgi:hypothetical protein
MNVKHRIRNSKLRFFGRASLRMTCLPVRPGHPDENVILNVARQNEESNF